MWPRIIISDWYGKCRTYGRESWDIRERAMRAERGLGKISFQSVCVSLLSWLCAEEVYTCGFLYSKLFVSYRRRWLCSPHLFLACPMPVLIHSSVVVELYGRQTFCDFRNCPYCCAYGRRHKVVQNSTEVHEVKAFSICPISIGSKSATYSGYIKCCICR